MSITTELHRIWKLLSESKNVPALLLAGVISTVGAGFLNPILSYYFREQGISFVGLGFIGFSASALSLVLRPLIGYISDRYGRRFIIIGSYLLLSIMTPFYLVVHKVAGLATIHSSRNVVAESSGPTLNAMIGDVAPKDGRATLYGFLSAIQSIAMSAAMIGGGAILVWGLRLEQLFYITAGCLFMATAVLAFFLKETVEVKRRTEASGPEGGFSDRLKSRLSRFYSGAQLMVRDRSSLGLMVYSFFFSFALKIYAFYVPLLVTEVFGVGPEYIGPIVASSWITFAVVQPFGGWLSDNLGKRKLLIVPGLALIVLFNTSMALSSTLLWVVVFWALIGVGDGMFRPVMSAFTVDIVPPDKRGTYFGTVGSMGGIANMAAPIVYGYAAEFYGIRSAFLITSLCYVCAALVVTFLVKEGRVIGEKA